MRHHLRAHALHHPHRRHRLHDHPAPAPHTRYRHPWLVAAAVVAALALFSSIWLQPAPPAAPASVASPPPAEGDLVPVE